MAFVYQDNVNYVRPGVYRKYSKSNTGNNIASALDGYGAIAIHADWGPLGVVTSHNSAYTENTIEATYGSGGTVNIAKAFMDGGLNTLHIIRLGSVNSGATGKTALKTSGTDAAEAVELELLYPGEHEFTVTVKDKLGEDGVRVLIIYDGAAAVETIEYNTSANDIAALCDAVKSYGSSYIKATAKSGVSGKIGDTAGQKFTGGANPTVTNADYSESFVALEPYYYNVMALDTVDSGVQALLKTYMNSAASEGNLGFAVIGENGTSSLNARLTHASEINDPTVIYFGSNYIASGNRVVSEAEAIAKAAGVIAATPSNQSIVHLELPGAVNVTERLRNSDYVKAIENGLLLLSVSADGRVVFDSGVNTLVKPSDDQDDGWKKIKRAKVRHEAMNRLDRTLEPLTGKVNATADGIANVIQVGQQVLDEMAQEQKLIDPEFAINEKKGYGDDYAYFVINAVDVDTLERIFLDYRFDYSENA